MLLQDETIITLIDVQERLLPVMAETGFVDRCKCLLEAAEILSIPVIYTEQLPEKLGGTIAELTDSLPARPIIKSSFSACGSDEFISTLEKTGKKQVLICGIEAHICVYQTVHDLLKRSYDVHVMADAISSRNISNKDIAISRMASEGAVISSVEMAIMEVQKVAEGQKFKQLLKVIK